MRRALLRLRPILVRPGRLVASVLGVAVGVAAVVATIAGSDAAVASLADDVERIAGPTVLEIRGPGGVPFDRLVDLAPVADTVELAPVVEDTALVERPDGTRERLRVLGLDLLSDARLRSSARGADGFAADVFERSAGGGTTGTVGWTDEALRTALFENGALLPTPLAEDLDSMPGAALTLYAGGERRELPVVATFDPLDAASPWARTLLVDVSTARLIFERGARFDRLELVPRGGRALDARAIAALERRTEALITASRPVGGDAPRLWVDPPSARRAEGERLVSSLRFNLTALSAVSMLVGIALVATTLATSVVQRRDRLALMRSLGASRAQLAAGVLGEAAIIGVVGGLLGVVFGALGARFTVKGVEGAAYSLAPEAASAGAVAFEAWWLPFGLALGIGAALFAAVLPLREALDVPPIQNLRAERPTRLGRRGHFLAWGAVATLVAFAVVALQLPPIGRRPVFALTACIALLAAAVACTPSLVDLVARAPIASARRGVALRLAQAALASSRGRAAWAAGAVAIAVGLAVAMATMVGSFRRTIVEWTTESMSADLFISSSAMTAVDEDVVATTRATFGDERTLVYRQADARHRDERILLGGSSFAVNAEHGTAPILDGRTTREAYSEALAEGGAIVNEPFARRFDRWPGDTIEIDAATGTFRAPITAVVREFSGQEGRVYIDESVWLAQNGEAPARSIAVFLPAEDDTEAARERLLLALGDDALVDVVGRRALFDAVLSIFDRTFAVTVALQVLASIAAALAVVTVLGALVRERRFDLAVVRVVGATRSQVAALVLGEAFVLGAVGALAGLVLGVAVGYILVTVVNVQSHGWSLSFQPPTGPALVTAAAVLPACVVAGLPPAIGAMIRPPREVLRETG